MKYLLLSAIFFASVTQTYSLAFADEKLNKAVETVWTSPELDGEVLELFINSDTNIVYPEKALLGNDYNYSLAYFDSLGNISKTVSLGRGGTITWNTTGTMFCTTNGHTMTVEGEVLKKFNLIDQEGKIQLTKDSVGHMNAISPDGEIIVSINGRKGLVELYNKNGTLINVIDERVIEWEAVGPRGYTQFAGDKIFVLVDSEMRSGCTFYAINRQGRILYKINDLGKKDWNYKTTVKGDFVFLTSGNPGAEVRKYNLKGQLVWGKNISSDYLSPPCELSLSDNNKYIYVYLDCLGYIFNVENGRFIKNTDERIRTTNRAVLVFNNGTVMTFWKENIISFMNISGQISIQKVPKLEIPKYITVRSDKYYIYHIGERNSINVQILSQSVTKSINALKDFTNEK